MKLAAGGDEASSCQLSAVSRQLYSSSFARSYPVTVQKKKQEEKEEIDGKKNR